MIGNVGKNARRPRRNAGLTVVEMLIVVAFILVLCAVSVPNTAQMLRSSRQVAADRSAEQLYTALARNVKSVEVSGNQSSLNGGAEFAPVASGPAGAPRRLAAPTRVGGDVNAELIVADTLYYISSDDAATSAAKLLMPDGSVGEEFLAGKWLILYTPGNPGTPGTEVNGKLTYQSPSVVGVFYCRAEDAGELLNGATFTNYVTANYNDLLTRDGRLDLTGGRVGYYSANSTKPVAKLVVEVFDAPESWLRVENAEELTVTAYCEVPDKAAYSGLSVRFTLNVASANGTASVTLDGVGKISPDAVNTYAHKFTLDSLEEGKNFKTVCAGLIPGEDVRLSLTAELVNAANEVKYTAVSLPRDTTDSARGVTDYDPTPLVNSLFERRAALGGSDTTVAYIAYGRHLQNLDAATSGVDIGTINAMQTADINWGAAYPDLAFTPIANTEVTAYDGQKKELRALTTAEQTDDNAGLFATFAGARLTNVYLVDPTIGAGTYAGALAGETEKDATVYGCRVWLESLKTKTADLLVGTSAAGGLVGKADAKLTIANSFAATAVEAPVAGGLVGSAEGTLTASLSYADCYLSGTTVGGLAGSGSGTFSNCLSAGFATGTVTTAGGFLGSGAATLRGKNVSLFNFDDVTSFTAEQINAVKVEDNHVTAYPDFKSAVANRYGVAPAVNVNGATGCFCYGGDVKNVSGAEYLSVADIMTKYGLGEKSGTAYGATGKDALNNKIAGQTLPNLLTGLAHYGDWLERPITEYTVTFETGEGGSTVPTQTVIRGGTATKPEDPTRESYAFGGWYTDEGGTQEYDFATPVTADITLYAKWTLARFKVTFVTDGGEPVPNPNPQEVESGETATRPSQDPEKTGYVFDNWYKDEARTEAYDFATPVTENITLYAKWTQVFTVTFDSNGGSAVASQTVEDGGKAAKPADPTKSYHEFGGWYKNLSDETAYDFDTPVTEDITLTAMWNRLYAEVYRDNNGVQTLVFRYGYEDHPMANYGTLVSGARWTGEQFLNNTYNPPWVSWSDKDNIYKAVFDESVKDHMTPTSMYGWFSTMKGLTTVQGAEYLDTSKVTTMFMTFNYCNSLTTLDLSCWDTSKVTNMQQMFRGCNSLTELNLSGWDTSKVTNMQQMFERCNALTELDLSDWDTSKVTTMYQMFLSCNALTKLNVSGWDTPNVTTMKEMFHYCYALTELDLSGWNTSKVTTMNQMFWVCEKLVTLDISGWDTSNVTNMEMMFAACNELTTIYASDKFNTDKIEMGTDMFGGNEKLRGGMGTTFNTSQATSETSTGYKTDKTRAHLDGGPEKPGYFTDKNAAAQIVYGVYDAETKTLTFQATPPREGEGTEGTDWFTLDGTKTYGNGGSGSNLDTVPWLVKREEITKIVLNVPFKPTSTASWFYQCSALTEVDLSGLDPSGLTTGNCLNNMFYDCSNLERIYVKSGFALPTTAGGNAVFKNCKAIKGGNNTTYNQSKIGGEYARIDTAETPGYFTDIAAKSPAPASAPARRAPDAALLPERTGRDEDGDGA